MGNSAITATTVSPTTTKGDMEVNNGTNIIRLTAGANDEVLTADSTEPGGVKWAAAAGGSTIAFKAIATSQTFASTTKINFNLETYDIGGNYDHINNRFTAPSDGVYNFNALISFNPTSAVERKALKFYINGQALSYERISQSGGWVTGNSNNTMLHTIDLELSAGNYVEVYFENYVGSCTTYGWACTYSGFKV